MTLEEVMRSNKDMLTPADVAPILGRHPHSIRLQAREDPAKLGFGVCVVGNKTLIPRIAFLRFMTGAEQ